MNIIGKKVKEVCVGDILFLFKTADTRGYSVGPDFYPVYGREVVEVVCGGGEYYSLVFKNHMPSMAQMWGEKIVLVGVQ